MRKFMEISCLVFSYILSFASCTQPVSLFLCLQQLLPNLYHLGSAAREEVNSSSVGPIQEKLESMAGEVTNVMDQQLQVESEQNIMMNHNETSQNNLSYLHSLQTLLESMVDAAEALCPHVMKKSNLRQELMKASSSKMVVPKSFVTKTLLEQSGVDIINKMRSVCVFVG